MSKCASTRRPTRRAPSSWRRESVAIGGCEEVMLAVPVAHRGVCRWNQFELRTTYPFGWFRAWTYVQAPLTAFVAPAPGGNRPLPAVTAASGEAARFDSRGEEDFAGLRSYTPGIPLKHMAWKTLARGGEAAVRVYSDLGARPEWLEWSSLEGLDTEMRLSQSAVGSRKRDRPSAALRHQDPGGRDPAGPGRRSPLAVPACAGLPWDAAGMKLAAPTATRVTYEQLRWMSACLVLALVVHTTSLPVWLLATVAAAIAIRLALCARALRGAFARAPDRRRGGLHRDPVPATSHIQRGRRGKRTLESRRGTQTVRDRVAARPARRRLDHLFPVPRRAADERVVLAARLPARRLLADERDAAAPDADSPLSNGWRRKPAMRPASAPRRCRSPWSSGCSSRGSTGRCGACPRTRAARRPASAIP